MNNTSNSNIVSFSTVELMTWAVTLAVLDVSIVLSNAFVFYYYSKSQHAQRSRANYFLMNLAFMDILVGTVSLPLYIYFMILWLKTEMNPWDLLYKMYMCIDIFSGIGSMYTVVVISLDRFFAIVFPFRHRVVSRITYVYSLAGVWLVASALSGSWLTLISIGKFSQFFHYLDAISIVLALVVISTANVLILIKVKLRRKQQMNLRKNICYEKKLTRILQLVTLAFFLTWIPFQSINFIYFYLKSTDWIPLNVTYFTRFLNYSGSFVNSVIYYNNNPEFKKTLKLFVRGMFLPSREMYQVSITARAKRANQISLEVTPPSHNIVPLDINCPEVMSNPA